MPNNDVIHKRYRQHLKKRRFVKEKGTPISVPEVRVLYRDRCKKVAYGSYIDVDLSCLKDKIDNVCSPFYYHCLMLHRQSTVKLHYRKYLEWLLTEGFLRFVIHRSSLQILLVRGLYPRR